MTKEQANSVKRSVNELTGKQYKMTFSGQTETLHIRIGTYIAGREDGKEEIKNERDSILNILYNIFPEYEVSKNNKRYQGYINDICITMK